MFRASNRAERQAADSPLDCRDKPGNDEEKGMAEMSAKFREMGGQVYVEADGASAVKTTGHLPGEAESSVEAVQKSNEALG